MRVKGNPYTIQLAFRWKINYIALSQPNSLLQDLVIDLNLEDIDLHWMQIHTILADPHLNMSKEEVALLYMNPEGDMSQEEDMSQEDMNLEDLNMILEEDHPNSLNQEEDHLTLEEDHHLNSIQEVDHHLKEEDLNMILEEDLNSMNLEEDHMYQEEHHPNMNLEEDNMRQEEDLHINMIPEDCHRNLNQEEDLLHIMQENRMDILKN